MTTTLTAHPGRLHRFFPGLTILDTYERSWLTKDLVAGIVLTAFIVPVGMGYANACGLPAECGVYATIVPLIAYALFGRSRILVLGPDSSLTAIIAATIFPLAAGSGSRAVALAGMLAILSGVLCILGGMAKFGFVTDLLSKPIRYGYLNGIALTLIASQLPTIFGFNVSGHDVIAKINGLGQGIVDQQTNWAAFSIGIGCMLIIFICRRISVQIPGVLLAVIVATTAVTLFDLSNRAGIAVVGSLPYGFPAFQFPFVSIKDIQPLCIGAIAIALVSFADMSVVSRAFGLRGGYQVDDNQELMALGASNLASGCFQGFSISASVSRTPVAESAGGKTQLTCLFAAAGVLLVLVFASSLLQNLPNAALAAIVISACVSLVEIRGLVRLYQLRPVEFWFSMVTFLGVALVGVIQGIFFAVALALGAVIWRAWRPHDAVLGRVDGLKGYHDILRHPDAKRIPGLVLFRWDASLFFANARIFHEHVLKAVAESPTPAKWIVVDAEPVTDIDITAADVLAELSADLNKAGIQLCFAGMKGPEKDLLKRYGLFAQFGIERFFPTIGQAVDGYLKVHQVQWQDWDEVKSEVK